MVHSGSTSPMKTTPSASPHLTVPATAPPLMISHGGTAVQELNHIPTQLLTTDLTPNSGFTQPSTLTPADSKSTVVTQEKISSKALVSTPAPAPISGRTSGRKRTPKACKCCGPNSTGHNVKTSASGRGRGRGRGTVRNMGHIPKSNFQVSSINHLNFAEEKLEEEDVEDTCGEVQRPVAVDNAPSQTTETPVSFQELPVKRCAESEQQQVKKKKKADQDSAIGAALQKEDGDHLNTEKKLLGTADQGGFVVRSQEIEGREIEIKGAKGGAITSKSNALGQSLPGENQNTQNSQHKCRGDTNTINSSFRNGESVNLGNTEEEVQEDYIIVIDSGSLSTSWPITPGTLQVLDSESEVFHSPERVDLFLAPTLSNGGISSSKNNSSSPMVEKPHLSMVLSPAFSPITVRQKEHPWAIWDHKLYAQSGTWDDFDEETSGRKSQQETGMDGTMPKEEILEHLTHMVHEFLEQFYIKYGSFIPLTETDVLEHLKTKCSPDLIDSGLDIKGEIKRYRAGLASAPFTSFMVTYNKHTLSLEDLGTLEEQNWLNDQIINMYGELIMEATEHKVHFFNSFFHKQLVAKGYEGVKRWTKKVDLFSKWLLLIPIHLEIHWSLVTVTMATKTISYYDSQGIVFRHTTDNIMKYLQSEASEKKLTGFQKGWTTAIIKGIPQQKNDSDCGVFILEYCRRLSVKKPLLFSQEDMPFIRKRIYKELCDCHLND